MVVKQLAWRYVAHFSDERDAGEHDAMMFVVEQRAHQGQKVLDQFGFFSNDPTGAESRLLLQVRRTVSHDALDIG